MLGAQIDGPQQATFNGLHLDFYPRVTWSPFFAMTTDDLKVCWLDILPVQYLIRMHWSAANKLRIWWA